MQTISTSGCSGSTGGECIPFAFWVYATYEVNSRLSDLKIHSIIDKLNPNLRSIENFNGKQRIREFYAMSPEDAYSILEAIAEIHGCADKLKQLLWMKPRSRRRKPRRRSTTSTKSVSLLSASPCVTFNPVRRSSTAITQKSNAR